jgi:HIV Tat-specific factor 1
LTDYPTFPILQKEEDGVMTIKFKDAISAQACLLVSLWSRTPELDADRHWLQKMNGRFFGGRQVSDLLAHRFPAHLIFSVLLL